MDIHLEHFFPCAANRFQKLFKVIALDFEHEISIYSDLNDYLLEAAEKYAAEKKSQGKEYWRLNQIVSDLDREIKEKKKANGVPYTKDELKAAKERLKELKESMREAKRKAETAIRNEKAIQKNHEQLKDHVRKLN